MNVAWIVASFALAASGHGSLESAAAPVRSESITANVDMSEWGPPGQVSLDLRSGRYELTPAAPRRGSRPSDTFRVRGATLAAAQLEQVRAAFAAARAQGLTEPVCEAGGAPPRIVISNAGTPFMVLTGERGTSTASKDLGCWTGSAQTLHNILETTFASNARPGR
jgi:hypothetical protein